MAKILDDNYELDEKDPASYSIIPPGEYNFEVMDFKRTREPYRNKKSNIDIGDCPCREVSLKIYDDDGHDFGGINDKLYLIDDADWKLKMFFSSIGMRKHGEKFRMDWEGAKRKHGRVKIKNTVKDSTKTPGEKVIFCNVERYLDPPTASAAPASGDDNPL